MPCAHPMIFQMNALDTLGQTALHRAALAGHLQTCRLLLSYGSDPSIISLQGFTAAQMGNEAVQQILSGELKQMNGEVSASRFPFHGHRSKQTNFAPLVLSSSLEGFLCLSISHTSPCSQFSLRPSLSGFLVE